MSAPTNNTRIFNINTPYGVLRSSVTSSEEHLIILLNYQDLANIIEISGKPNWEALNLDLCAEIENTNFPEETFLIQLPIPEEIIHLTPEQIRRIFHLTPDQIMRFGQQL